MKVRPERVRRDGSNRLAPFCAACSVCSLDGGRQHPPGSIAVEVIGDGRGNMRSGRALLAGTHSRQGRMCRLIFVALECCSAAG